MRFRFTALDGAGATVNDVIEASDESAAHAALAADGLEVVELHRLDVEHESWGAAEPPQDGPPSSPLATEVAEQLVTQVAELQAARIPLETGLRAAARGTTERRLRAALEAFALRLEQGVTLEDACQQLEPDVPPHLLGLLRAVERTGGQPEVLLTLTEDYERSREVRQSVWIALAYPLTTLVIALMIFVAVHLLIVRGFRRIFEDFQLSLPFMTQVVLWWSAAGAWIVLALLAAAAILLIAVWSSLGTARWRHALASAPLIGVIWLWGGAAQFCRLISLLLRHELPLPEVLELTAAGAGDGLFQRIAADANERVQRGASFSQALRATRGVPSSLIPFVAAGEQHADLPETLTAAAEMFDERVRQRAAALKRALPPLIFVCVMVLAVFTIVGLFMPMLNLLRAIN